MAVFLYIMLFVPLWPLTQSLLRLEHIRQEKAAHGSLTVEEETQKTRYTMTACVCGLLYIADMVAILVCLVK